jgi:hypothetical protein
MDQRCDTSAGRMAGSLGQVPFVHYALTIDLLETELVDAIAARIDPRSLPLPDTHLPDVLAVLDLSSRVCGGGALAVCVIARSARLDHAADYVLLVQERSSR